MLSWEHGNEPLGGERLVGHVAPRLSVADDPEVDLACQEPGDDLRRLPLVQAGVDVAQIVRIGFGFRNFENYRIRALLYAGKPNWRVLGSIVVR